MSTDTEYSAAGVLLVYGGRVYTRYTVTSGPSFVLFF